MRIMYILASAMLLSFSIQEPFNFEKAWEEVEKSIEEGLSQEAMNKSVEIYNAAVQEGLWLHRVRAVIVISALKQQYGEEAINDILTNIVNETELAPAPFKNLLLSHHAYLINAYFQENRYEIANRTEMTVRGDIQTMTTSQFADTIATLYWKSLEGGDILNAPVEEYKGLLTDFNPAGADRMPTLYHILADRSLYHFASEPLMRETSGLGDENIWFFPVNGFVENEDFTLDGQGTYSKVFEVFRKIIGQSKLSGLVTAEAYFNLKRLSYAHLVSIQPLKDSLFMTALEEAARHYRQNEMAAEYYENIANRLLQSERIDRYVMAIEWCNKAIKEYPYSQAAFRCAQMLTQIIRKELNIQSEEAFYSKEKIRYKIIARNIDHVYIKVISQPSYFKTSLDTGVEGLYDALRKEKEMAGWHHPIADPGNHNEVQSSFDHKGFSKGSYLLLCSNRKDFSGVLQVIPFQVTNLSYVTFVNANERQILVVDRKNGKPVHKALVAFYSNDYDYANRKYNRILLTSKTTDRNGKVIAPFDQQNYVLVVKHKKDIFDSGRQHYSYRNEPQTQDVSRVELYTDRAIYRPGQVVYVKALYLNYRKGKYPAVVEQRDIDLTLNDANGQEVAKIKLTTNEFGSASGSFTLPFGRLTGNFYINSTYGAKSIRVEEYKRPKFEVKLDSLQKSFALGEKVTLTGYAMGFAGNAINDAKLNYKVYRRALIPYCFRWYPEYFDVNEYAIKDGELETDKNGKFEISFTAEPGREIGVKPIYIFSVDITVISGDGETQTTEYNLPLSARSGFLESNLPTQFDKSIPAKLRVSLKNASGIDIAGKVKVKVMKLKEPLKLEPAPYWNMPKQAGNKWSNTSNRDFSEWHDDVTVWSEDLESGGDTELSFLQAGVYRVVINSENADSLSEYLEVTDFDHQKLPGSRFVFHQLDKTIYRPGDIVTFKLGAAMADQTVYMVLIRGEEILRQEWIKLNRFGKIEYSITEADNGGLKFIYFYVTGNRYYQEEALIDVPWEDKQLKIELESFRDITLPGSQEEYKVKVSGLHKETFQAEVLATMYDASLDQFEANRWNTSFYYTNYPYLSFEHVSFSMAYGLYLHGDDEPSPVEPSADQPIIPSLWLGPFDFSAPFTPGANVYDRIYKTAAMADGVIMEAAESSAPPPPIPASEPQENAKSTQSTEVIQPRKNLNETVFFFPSLLTDEKGNLVLSFKMNEALTRWRLMLMAHNKEMATGYLEKYLTTSKEIMIISNSPRFVREGDELVFSAAVSNLSKESKSIMVGMSVRNELNDQPLNEIIKSVQDTVIELLPGMTKPVFWKLKIEEGGPEILQYTVNASSGNVSDAERNTLQVLSNKILIKESMPIYVNASSEKSYTMSSLAQANFLLDKPHLYAIEMTSHPLWYAIQAMPYVVDQDNESPIQLAMRYYTHSLARFILQKYPQIETVFNIWRKSDPSTFLSQLEKNPDLKTAILEETPWVMDAISESTSKANVIRLFDSSTLGNEIRQDLGQLFSRRLDNGSYSWYAGGRFDYYTTRYVAEQLGRILKENMDAEAMQGIQPTVHFLDTYFKDQYLKLLDNFSRNKTNQEDYFSGVDVIQHLYVRSLFPFMKIEADQEIAYAYYYKQALKYRTKYDIYTQALLGIYDFKSKGSAWKSIFSSLVQLSKYSEEMGRYWNAGTGFKWNELPIERHAALMEFFFETGADQAMLDELKIWLIKNKQTHSWNTAKSTIYAINALMQQKGPKQINLVDAQDVIVKAGNERLPLEKSVQAGTSYFIQTWNEAEVNKSMANINLENKGNSIAYGAAYYQYFKALDKVEAYHTMELKMDKKLFKESMKEGRTTLVEVSESTVLRPGDVLVSRLIIQSDRDLEYVHVKDNRGSGMVPFQSLSGYRWLGPFGFYESIRDQATHYFIDQLPRGIHVFESRQRVVHKGNYSGTLATIQCLYAPEFGSHTSGTRLVVR
ncbi:MAG: hypothetical protein IPN29_10690 [Saprospiraceae bacterium]|nr:hypothetical protein [Saprospiraceae bacterium]